MSNAMSLKAKIRNIAKQKNIPAQVIFGINILRIENGLFHTEPGFLS